MQNSITVPGKVILLGEHAVVHGYPALGGALQTGAHLQILPGSGVLQIPQENLAVVASSNKQDSLVSQAYYAGLVAFSQISRIPAQQQLVVDFVVDFSIPARAGLGSSAALALAITRGLEQTFRHKLTISEEFACAQAIEEIFHGTNSGLDVTLCQRRGLGLFSRKHGWQPAPHCALSLCIAWSGQTHVTQKEVAKVQQQAEQNPKRIQSLFYQISECVAYGYEALQRCSWPSLGHAFMENHKILQELQLSTARLDFLCDSALQAGALGAKVTGAGGGGCVIALAPGLEQRILTVWQQAGFSCFQTILSSP